MKKFSKILVFALALVMLFGTVQVFAFEPYDTYTYSIDGNPMKSPTAYRAEDVYDSLKMGLVEISPNTPTSALQAIS